MERQAQATGATETLLRDQLGFSLCSIGNDESLRDVPIPNEVTFVFKPTEHISGGKRNQCRFLLCTRGSEENSLVGIAEGARAGPLDEDTSQMTAGREQKCYAYFNGLPPSHYERLETARAFREGVRDTWRPSTFSNIWIDTISQNINSR